MNPTTKCFYSVFFSTIFLVNSLSADTNIDFDEFAGIYNPGTAIGVEEGYSVASHVSGDGPVGIGSVSPTGNGVAQFTAGTTPVLAISRAAPFAFVSFDVRDQFTPADPITVTGYLLGALQATDIFDPDPGPAMTTMNSVNLAGVTIDELRISFPVPSRNWTNFDNVYLCDPPSVVVPEPSTYITWGVMGLVGPGLYWKRRKK